MAVTTIAGKLVPLQLSFNSGTTWKNVVCLVTSPLRSSKTTTREQTQCGPHVATGEHTWGFDVTGVVNDTPTTASEVSASDLLAAHINDVKPMVRMDVGSSIHTEGKVVIPEFGIENPVEGLARFTARLEGDGNLDITA